MKTRARASQGRNMIYFTAAVAIFLLVYLFTALIRPEWF